MHDSFARLREALAGAAFGNAVSIAFSGGLDSRFLVHASLLAGYGVRVFHVRGPHIPAHETAYALDWAARNGVQPVLLDIDPLAEPLLRDNPKDRCYHCKRVVFSTILRAVRERFGEGPLCDGTNLSDAGEYRPGRKALGELGVHSPLAEAGLAKKDIRFLAARTGMENPEQTAQPCLLTRFGYGAALSSELLKKVGAGEEAVLRVLHARGMMNAPFRLRYEVAESPALHLAFEPGEELAEELGSTLAANGFPGAPVRVVERLSGFFDRQ